MESRFALATVFGLTSSDQLIQYDSASPTTVSAPIAITNVTAGETLVGIDFRPQNGLLYGLGVNAATDTATLYAISTRTGVAGVVGAAPSTIAFTTDGTTVVDFPDPATVGYGFDFNPAVDRIRVVAGSLNFRANPNTGGPVDGDNGGGAGSGTGTNPDGNTNMGTTTVDAAAYTNNQPNNGNITTLYTLDASLNQLFIQSPPNMGTQSAGQTVMLGGSTLDFTTINGFDILAGVNAAASNAAVTTGSAFAALNVGGTTGLYSINLVNAQATLIGNIGNGTTAVQGLAVQNGLGGFPAVSLDAAGLNLVRFNTATPGTTTTAVIGNASLAAGEQLVGIDFRPATGQLYGLAVNQTANTGTLYLIDPQTGALTAVGAQGQIAFTTDGSTVVDLPDPATAGYGFDFNPTVDRIRVTTSTGLNFRVNPFNGAPVDGNLGDTTAITGTNPDGSIQGGGSTGISATAYTNSFHSGGNGTTVVGVTTQYTLDAASNTLFIQNPPNTGTQTTPVVVTLAGSPLDFTAINGFDIPAGVRVTTSNTAAAGNGFAALTVGGVTRLYRINLQTGVATNLGTVGSGASSLAGLTLADTPDGPMAPTFQFSSASYSVGESGPVATITVTRTGDTTGTQNVGVATFNGTATSPADFADSDQVLTFGPGETSETFTIAIVNDNIDELDETVNLALLGGGTLGSPSMAELTIIDNDAAPTVTINDVTMNEGNSGTTAFTFTVTLSNASSQAVTVDFATQDSSATVADGDYVANAGTLTFAPSVTTQTITVLVNGDTTIEPNESFLVNLLTATNAVIADPQGQGNITNDDAPVVIPPQPPGAGLFEDPEDPGEFVLLVTGTAKSDSIVIKPVKGQIQVFLNGKVVRTVSPSAFGRIEVRAGAGNDSVVIASSISVPATVFGEAGNDSIVSGSGSDFLVGGLGKDVIIGNGGDDEIFGDEDNDVLKGGAGDDTMTGGGGSDVMTGDSGDDTLNGDEGNDVVKGGSGDDNVSGDDGNDVVTGDSGTDTVSGGIGNDTVLAGSGDDIADGGEGNDVVAGESGNDSVTGGDGNDIVKGGSGDDLLFGGEGNDKLFGESGNDLMLGEAGNDFLYGGAGRDIMVGGEGADTLYGDGGDDILVGGTTSADEDEAAAADVFAAWTANASYNDRVTAVLGLGITIEDDGAVDNLFGQGNQDLFFAELNDRKRDQAKNELNGLA